MESEPNRNLRFLADDMVHRLAKWLRTLGYDVLYLGVVSDDRVARTARIQNRIVLTRDRSFGQRFTDLRVFSTSEENPWHQLIEVIREYHLDLEMGLFTRCTLCNTLLEPISLDQCRNQVPPLVLERTMKFLTCPECKRLYWEGTHTDRIRKQIREIRETLSSLGLQNGNSSESPKNPIFPDDRI